LIYSNLGEKVTEFRDQRVANMFFKNFLSLCSEIDDPLQQKKYILFCKKAI